MEELTNSTLYTQYLPIKGVSIISYKDIWFDFKYVLKESL